MRKKIKISTKNNEIKNKNTIGKINKVKSWFHEKTNEIDKLLSKLNTREGINNIRKYTHTGEFFNVPR